MEILLAIAIIVVALWIVSVNKKARERTKGAKAPSKGRKKSSSPVTPAEILEFNMPWLSKRWSEMDRQRDSLGKDYWFFKSTSNSQIDAIKGIGLNLEWEKLNRGMASDVLELFEPIEPSDLQVLRFFKISPKDYSKIRGKFEVERLLSDAENAERWSTRPADALQKEFYRFCGEKVPPGLTCKQAEKDANKNRKTLSEKQASLWAIVESVWRELQDPEVRESYDIKRATPSAIRKAVETLISEGKNLEEIEHEVEDGDIDSVVLALGSKADETGGDET